MDDVRSEFPCPSCGAKKRFHKKGCEMEENMEKEKDKKIDYSVRECSTCRSIRQNPAMGIYECHRFPPVGRWPVVGLTEYCDEYKAIG